MTELLGRGLLGEGASEARSRGAADAAAVRQAVREDEQARRGGRRGLLRGGAAPRDAVRAGQGRGPAGAADAAPGARATPQERTATINALRAQLAEFGIVAAQRRTG